jgi:hypothetical protein
MSVVKLLMTITSIAITQVALAQWTAPGNALPAGSYMYPGAQLTSPNGQNRLIMQYDGNLVMYNAYWQPLWNSNTAGRPGSYMVLQYDGNLVVRDGNGYPLYNIYDFSRNPHAQVICTVCGVNGFLSVEDDGNMIVFAGNVVWTAGESRASGSAGTVLRAGQAIPSGSSLTSPSGRFSLAMQTDGNLVLYDNGSFVWNSNTAGNPGAYAVLQTDGNFVVYGGGGRPIFYTNTQYTTSDGKYTTLTVSDAGLVYINNYFRNFALAPNQPLPGSGQWPGAGGWGIWCVVNSDLSWYCYPRF